MSFLSRVLIHNDLDIFIPKKEAVNHFDTNREKAHELGEVFFHNVNVETWTYAHISNKNNTGGKAAVVLFLVRIHLLPN